MTDRPPLTLAGLLEEELVIADDHARAADALAAAAADPAQHPLLGQAWGRLGGAFYYSDELADALGATKPVAALRAAAAGIAEHAGEVRAQLLAAAIELGDETGLRAVRSAAKRLLAIQFFGVKEFKHPQIGKLASDPLLVGAAIRALRRVQIPANQDTYDYDNRLLWALVSLVAVAGGEGAAEALEAVAIAAANDPEVRDRMVMPRLVAEKQREHVKAALERLSGSQKGPPPLPFLSAAPSLPAAEPEAKPGKGSKKPARIDDNLHFALLQALASAGQVKLPPMDDDGEQEMNPKVRKKLLAISIPPAFAAQLVKLTWSAGMPVQFSMYPFWSGEDDAFDVAHLLNLQPFTALEELDLELVAPNLDLAPLAGMARLKKLVLEAQVQSLAPLLELPGLAEVRVDYDDTDANRAVVTELQRRGVKLDRPR
ncbi:DUF6892 domain-containing protein [Nannocystis radixulma]|uniref:DUF6892 domain-containing protein n=1 Tax=Nannocystis radixulma TaxID=2995305 RepID=A0ABT5B4Y0_9BACT|nr:hypothetical protein [Nannocystis radixulma]MDC0669146.1 hypothetical protein [Nannocystis radixulma]